MNETELTPVELAALADALDLAPGYSMASQRAYVELDGELMWARLDGALPLEQPGMWRLQAARVNAWTAVLEEQRTVMLQAMTPEAHERYHEWSRAFRNLPDPEDWRIDQAREKAGRSTDR